VEYSLGGLGGERADTRQCIWRDRSDHNTDEPRALDYNETNQPGLYNPDAYRSSDHDPVVVGLRLGEWRKVYLPMRVTTLTAFLPH
jgi:hypothetical protein